MKILPLFIPHLGCPFDCVYCNQHQITKISQLVISEISSQIENFCKFNKQREKEIAFFGGTFTGIPQEFQQQLLDLVKPFLDKQTGIRISTRPDAISNSTLNFLKANGVTTIELGIQSFADEVLSKSKRGYTSKIAEENCRKIQSHNFKLGVQLMPGLPGFSSATLNQTINTTIAIKPDFIRIYPTIVLGDTKLAELYRAKLYSPLSLDEAIDISVKITNEMQKHNIAIIKAGLHSDIAPEAIIAGPYHPTFGELVRAEIYYQKLLKSYDPEKTLAISPADVSLFKGFSGKMIAKIKTHFQISKISILIDKNTPKNQFDLLDEKPTKAW
ncbi:MAG: radical SAM protein [Candidatus Cloacimonetes bacterium]|nr:radical SAM protein [Candidatus Cloacimonadota bacterium]